MPRLAVVIPALNEGKTIANVIAGVLEFADVVYVIDDGSTDQTSESAVASGARVIRNTRPLGYDAAIARGVNHAFAEGATAVVTCDGDGQHRPGDVARVAAAVTSGAADFATGLRDRYNRRIEAAIGFVARGILGTADPFCGLKCYGALMRACVGEFPMKMHIGTLPLVWVRNSRLRATFIPIAVCTRRDNPRFDRGFRADIHLTTAFLASLYALVVTSDK